VFLLVDEGTVKKYKADLSDEIEPQITELISRAEKGLEALQKKRLLLQTKVKTAQSKPQQPSASDGVNRRLQLLVKQRQRLEAQVRELEGEILEMIRNGGRHHKSLSLHQPPWQLVRASTTEWGRSKAMPRCEIPDSLLPLFVETLSATPVAAIWVMECVRERSTFANEKPG